MEITWRCHIKGEIKESVSKCECHRCVPSLSIRCRSLSGEPQRWCSVPWASCPLEHNFCVLLTKAGYGGCQVLEHISGNESDDATPVRDLRRGNGKKWMACPVSKEQRRAQFIACPTCLSAFILMCSPSACSLSASLSHQW